MTAEQTGPPEVEIVEAGGERLGDVESLWRSMPDLRLCAAAREEVCERKPLQMHDAVGVTVEPDRLVGPLPLL